MQTIAVNIMLIVPFRNDELGRRSPQQLISPSGGRRSPVFLMYDGNRTPLDLLEQRRSPTTMFPDRSKSPTGMVFE